MYFHLEKDKVNKKVQIIIFFFTFANLVKIIKKN